MAAGYLRELGLGEASTAGGRKPTLVEINRDYGYTVTFDLGYRHLHALVTFLDGHVWKYDRIETQGQSIHEMLAQIKQYLDDRDQESTTSHGLLGICFSIHGIVMDNQVRPRRLLRWRTLIWNRSSHRLPGARRLGKRS